MPIVYQLVKTLTPSELEQISRLPFQERERAVFEKIRLLNNAVFPSSTVCKNLKIQASHLDKINSHLLKKILKNLSGTNIYDQINYFDSKNGLSNASERLLKQYEQKKIIPSGKRNEKYIFYKFCFEWLLSSSTSAQADKNVEYYAERILENCTKINYRENVLLIRSILLRKEINDSGLKAVFTDPQKQNLLFNKLFELIQESETQHLPVCIYKTKLNAVVLNNMIHRFAESRKYLSEINDLITAHKGDFNENDHLIVKWHYAQILYYSSEFDESFKIYIKLYGKINKTDNAKWYIYTAEYFQVCLITKNYTIAKEICLTFFAKFFDDKNGRFYLSSIIQYVKYLLHTEQYEEAKNKLAALHKNMKKAASLQFQLALRELTVAYHYLTGNYPEALLMAEKNLKFMRTKKIHLSIPEYTFHSRLIKSILKQKLKNTSLDDENKLMFDAMQRGTMAQYGGLLKRLSA